MTDIAHVQEWLSGYRRAWESNDEADIRSLFSDDAEYRDTPGEDARIGSDEIVAHWLEHRDEPGETTFHVRVVNVDGDVAFVQAVTGYLTAGDVYDNLWVVTFAPDGRARSFTEWYMKRPHDKDAARS